MTVMTPRLPEATDQDLAVIKTALEAGQAQLALSLVQDLIANRQFSSVLHYWLAATHGACGDWPAFQDSLNQAQTFHGLEIIKTNGGDLLRFQHDLDYALAVAQRCWQARVFGPALAGFGRMITQDEVSPGAIIDHAHAVLAVGRLEEARLGIQVVDDVFSVKPDLSDHLAVLPFGEDALEAVTQAVVDWAEPYIQLDQAGPGPQMPNLTRSGRRLRLGYLIANVAAPGLDQTVLPALAAHDPDQFEIRLYYDQGCPRLDMGPVVLCPIGALEDEAVFERIRQDEIDVLIEASGHLGAGRLAILAAKAAPVQVSWTAAGLTTGLPSVDYVLLADGTVQTGPQAETRWPIGPVQTPFVARPALAQTKSEGAEAPGQRFGCLAHPADLDATTIDLFAQVMCSCGGASLSLNHANFRDPVVQNTASAIFAARGIDPDRLVFPDPVVISASDPVRPSLDPLTDMMLAPVGGIGLCDPDLLVGLSHGIPVLWLASFKPNVPNPLAALGLLDFMATDKADFVAKALDWMQRRASGGPERQALANRFAASAYTNLTAFTRRLELAYCLMFDVWSSSHAEPERIVTMHQWRVPSRHVLKRMA